MVIYFKTSASVEEDFKGKDLEEKVDFIDVLKINCILFIPGTEKQYCSFTYGDCIGIDSERYRVKLYNNNVK